MDIIKSIEHEQLKSKVPVLDVGNTVRVHAKIKEGNRERIQVFEGIIIKKQGGGVNETFTVRKISYGVGVEKTFLLHSPMVEKVEVVRVGKARRAKLFYLRDRLGKSARTREKIGARIETKELVLKENLEEEVPVEDVQAEEVERPAVETKNPVVEEVVDTVKEETVEEVKEEPVKEETPKEETNVEELVTETVEAPAKEANIEEPKTETSAENVKVEEPEPTETAENEATEKTESEE